MTPRKRIQVRTCDCAHCAAEPWDSAAFAAALQTALGGDWAVTEAQPGDPHPPDAARLRARIVRPQRDGEAAP